MKGTINMELKTKIFGHMEKYLVATIMLKMRKEANLTELEKGRIFHAPNWLLRRATIYKKMFYARARLCYTEQDVENLIIWNTRKLEKELKNIYAPRAPKGA